MRLQKKIGGSIVLDVTDRLRGILDKDNFEVLGYFTRAELECKLVAMEINLKVITKIMNGFYGRTVREIAELPDSELKRPNWTGETAFERVSQAILELLVMG